MLFAKLQHTYCICALKFDLWHTRWNFDAAGVDLGEGWTGVRTPVFLGQQRCKGGAKISITVIAVNVHHYKYSTLKREIKRQLKANQKPSNKATHRELSLNKTLNLHYFILKINICCHFNFSKMYEWPDVNENE